MIVDLSPDVVRTWLRQRGIRSWSRGCITPTCDRLGCHRKAVAIFMFDSRVHGTFSLCCAKHDKETTEIMEASGCQRIESSDWRGMCPPIVNRP